MAEKHEILELGNVSRNGKGACPPSSVARSSRFVALVKVLFGPSKKGVVLAPELLERSAASSSSVCSSTRIERLMRSRTGCAREVDWEIEASKDHWSELEPRSEELLSDPEDEKVHVTNAEIVESLRKQFPQTCDFFCDDAGFVEVGKKIAEGAQADIFTAKFVGSDSGYGMVLKVSKEGSLMRDLQKQWPLGMLNRCSIKQCSQGTVAYTSPYSSAIISDGSDEWTVCICDGAMLR